MVEDDDEFAADMAAILTPTVLLSRVDGSAAAAAELLRRDFDLVWLDLDLVPCYADSGALEGLAFLRVLRERYGPGLPVLIVSARLTEGVLAEVDTPGVLAALPKPPDLGRLREILKALSG